MLSIGKRASSGTDDVADLLTGCHERIRRFSRMAIALATSTAPAAERREAADAIIRYFTVALPLHEADEELSLAPRLRGRDAVVDGALDRMVEEHHALAVLLAPVLAGCGALRVDESAARALVTVYDAHLAAEEAIIFPAVARLPAPDRAAIRAELTARRAVSYPG